MLSYSALKKRKKKKRNSNKIFNFRVCYCIFTYVRKLKENVSNCQKSRMSEEFHFFCSSKNKLNVKNLILKISLPSKYELFQNYSLHTNSLTFVIPNSLENVLKKLFICF